MKNWKKSWNLKSSKEYEPCYIFCTGKGKSFLSQIPNATAGVDEVLGTVFEGFVFVAFRLCLTILPLFVCCFFFSVIKPRRIKVWAHGAGKSKSKDGEKFFSVCRTSSQQLV